MKFSKPNLKFNIMSKTEVLNNFLLFLSKESDIDSFTGERIISFYGLDKNELKRDKISYLKKVINKIYNKDDLINTLNELNVEWNAIEDEVLKTLSNIFDLSYDDSQIYSIDIGLNPVCPRFLDEHSFSLYYNAPIKYNIETIIHELIHFYWFEYWDNYIDNLSGSKKEYPSEEWVLSELAIDSLCTQTELKKFCSEKPAYDYFYDITYKDTMLINYFRQIFNKNTIDSFMKEALSIIKSENLLEQLIK